MMFHVPINMLTSSFTSRDLQFDSKTSLYRIDIPIKNDSKWDLIARLFKICINSEKYQVTILPLAPVDDIVDTNYKSISLLTSRFLEKEEVNAALSNTLTQINALSRILSYSWTPCSEKILGLEDVKVIYSLSDEIFKKMASDLKVTVDMKEVVELLEDMIKDRGYSMKIVRDSHIFIGATKDTVSNFLEYLNPVNRSISIIKI